MLRAVSSLCVKVAKKKYQVNMLKRLDILDCPDLNLFSNDTP